MWFEGVTKERPFSYVPGGIISNTATSNRAYLTKRYMFGSGGTNSNAFINLVTKTIRILLPDWVEDYDVLVKYVNCGPCTGAAGKRTTSVGLGSGLSVNKQSVRTWDSGAKTADFNITSASQNIPARLDPIADDENDHDDAGMVSFVEHGTHGRAGVIKDKIKGNEKSYMYRAPPEPNQEYQFLSYSVALPQFPNENYTTESQNRGPENQDLTRWVPKFGAAYYPTVSFTIIGYTKQGGASNKTYTETDGDFTMIVSPTTGSASVLLDAGAPAYNDLRSKEPFKIDIR